ncbi:MAG: hypothetical protein ACWGN1_02190 [Desulfobulbales bacterium]
MAYEIGRMVASGDIGTIATFQNPGEQELDIYVIRDIELSAGLMGAPDMLMGADEYAAGDIVAIMVSDVATVKRGATITYGDPPDDTVWEVIKDPKLARGRIYWMCEVHKR